MIGMSKYLAKQSLTTIEILQVLYEMDSCYELPCSDYSHLLSRDMPHAIYYMMRSRI